MVPLLTSHYRVVRLDLPGFGGSEIPKETWNLDKYVSFVNDFIHKLSLSPYALLGHSFGGRIIIKGSAQKVFNPGKIILIDSGGVAKRKTLRNYFFKIFVKIAGLFTYLPPFIFFRTRLRQRFYQFIGSTDYLNAGVLKDTFISIVNEDLSLNAKEVEKPVLLVWGGNDKITPLEEGVRLHELIKNSRLEVLKDCGHFPHNDKPKEVAELLKIFLQ